MPGAAASLVLSPVCAYEKTPILPSLGVGLGHVANHDLSVPSKGAQHHICSNSGKPCKESVPVIIENCPKPRSIF